MEIQKETKVIPYGKPRKWTKVSSRWSSRKLWRRKYQRQSTSWCPITTDESDTEPKEDATATTSKPDANITSAAGKPYAKTTTTAFSESDMKIINEKIKMDEKIFAKNRQETTQAETTTTKNPAFYNHGQKWKKQQDRKERYPPPRIYDCRKKKRKITFSFEN